MNKTAVTDYRRLFLIEKLPEPLEPKSAHIQIFDNYIEGTRMRLRLVRDPYSKNWTRILQQVIPSGEIDVCVVKTAEIYLNEAEYSNFEQFEGREIRKNRYYHEFGGLSFAFDVYLGQLWGLNIAEVRFQNAPNAAELDPPNFVIFDITADRFFEGANLVGKRFDDIREHVHAMGRTVPPPAVTSDD